MASFSRFVAAALLVLCPLLWVLDGYILLVISNASVDPSMYGRPEWLLPFWSLAAAFFALPVVFAMAGKVWRKEGVE